MTTGGHYDLRPPNTDGSPEERGRRRLGTGIGVGLGGAAAMLLIVGIFSIGGQSDEERQTDGAFILTLVDHHEAALDLAAAALERGVVLGGTTQELLDSHSEEVVRLREAHQRLYGEPVPPNAAHGSLGLSDSQIAGSVDASQLDGKGGVQASFVRAIEPNLRGSIKVAEAELRTGADAQLMRLARDVIAARERELRLLGR